MEPEMSRYAYIGTWGNDIQGNEKEQEKGRGGISAYKVLEDNTLKFIENVSPEVNAGIIAISSDNNFLYVTDERKDTDGKYGNGGGVYSYKINKNDGSLTYLNNVSSVGPYPCYIVTDSKNRYAFVSNHGHHDDVVTKAMKNADGKYEAISVYDDGNIVMIPIKSDGSLDECCDVKVLEGKSAVERYQDSAHPHSVWVDPTDQYLISGDKGADKIRIYKIDYDNGNLIELPAYDSLPGTGPRHIAFHPTLDVMYVNSEINSTVNAFAFNFDRGSIELIDTARTIPDPYIPPDPEDHFASNATADMRVHKSGKYLYVSNRGHNSVVSYKLNEQGKMELIGFTSTKGEIPRAINFDVDGDRFYAVNQRSGNIVQFLVPEGTGELIPTGYELKLSNPVCMQFIKV